MITKTQASHNRQEAQRLGATRYMGQPCKKGHSGLRYTSGSGCIECLGVKRGAPKLEAQRLRREAAKARGELTFEGTPCKRGHSLRYVKGNNCVACTKSRPKGDRRAQSRAYFESLSGEVRLVNAARERARKNGRAFTITAADIKVPSHCPVLGIPLKHGKGRFTDNSPSLDRIDNSKGYVPGNVVVISWRANRLKADAEAWELERLAAYRRGYPLQGINGGYTL